MTAAATNLAGTRWRALQTEDRALQRAAADPARDRAPALHPSETERFEGPVAEQKGPQNLDFTEAPAKPT